jgi:hypothetical protein
MAEMYKPGEVHTVLVVPFDRMQRNDPAGRIGGTAGSTDTHVEDIFLVGKPERVAARELFAADGEVRGARGDDGSPAPLRMVWSTKKRNR